MRLIAHFWIVIRISEGTVLTEQGLLEIESNTSVSTSESGRAVFIETYGCQMNVSDTELMMGVLKNAGYRNSSRLEDADIVLLNTCAIREHAEERVIGRLTQLSSLKLERPNLVLGVSGCMAKHMAEKLTDRLPYVDLVLGPDSYRNLPDLIEAASEVPALDVRLDRDEDYLGLDPIRKDHTNAWVTIMRGCDKFCTFCIVPYVRGRERSVSCAEIVRQVRAAASEGFREVTLLGQTVNSYNDGHHDFADLLGMVAEVEGIYRVRFTSPHPSDFSDRLIHTLASEEKVCKYIHLPVQSGSRRVLEAMDRSYTPEEYLALVDRLRESIPGLSLSTDIIVGFPGEEEEDFLATIDVMRSVRFDSAYMFKYSEREGTVAYKSIPDSVPEAEKGRRLEQVISLQNEISYEINQSFLGKTVEVLVQGPARKNRDHVVGRSNEFKTVVFPRNGVEDNSLVQVQISEATQRSLLGCLKC